MTSGGSYLIFLLQVAVIGASDAPCTSKGGSCWYTNQACSGYYDSSPLCDGPDNRQCCRPIAGGDVQCTSRGGTCKYTNVGCAGHYDSSPWCAGPDNRQCCLGNPLPKPVSGISCSTVLSRAAYWANRKVPYSMSLYTNDPNGKQYRQDCSGYVSMAWGLSTSLSTVTLVTTGTAKRISKDQLRAGDVLMKGGPGSEGANGHVVLFEKWTSTAKTNYWAYEQTPPNTVHRIVPYPYFYGGSGYLPYRGPVSC